MTNDLFAADSNEMETDTSSLHIIEPEEPTEDGTVVRLISRNCTIGDNPLLVWVSEIDSFVKEFLRLEGHSDLDSTTVICAGCDSTEGTFRCPQCLDTCLFCQDCLMWNGLFFEQHNLRALGLRIQLNHPPGDYCPIVDTTFKESFVIISLNGIFTCVAKSAQLLRARLFPATIVEPRTAATFEVLQLFQLLTFGSKVSGYEFYQSLIRLSSNLGEIVPERYSAFMRIVREWRHIHLLKCSARGHDPTGVAGTKEGECAVLCPAWIYSLFVAIDANFRLKRLAASSNVQDPGLNKGYAYFIDEKKYKSFLDATGNLPSEEPSTCNNYDAVKLATIRGGKGMTASGVGTIECSRHDMKCPLSVGDLQLGERYCNMDYLYFSSLQNHSPSFVVTSYDIACQWSRNLQARAASYPEELVGPRFNQLSIKYLVPKFHLYAHWNECQINYSFNLTPNVGHTDGESPERRWAAMNPVASSTKEMGPCSQRDTLDDHFGNYNWRKVISLHTSLLRKAQEALQMQAEHVKAFKAFSNALPTETTASFLKLIWAWEADSVNMTNPYEPTLQAISQAKIRLELAEEDTAAMARDQANAVHDGISPGVFIAQGLELQDQQVRLQSDVKALSNNATDHQRTQIIEHQNRLHWRILVSALRSSEAEGDTWVNAEDLILYLPSEVVDVVSVLLIAEYEWRLRYGQAFDTLGDLRHRYSRGQQHNTRSMMLVKNVQARVNTAVNKYLLGKAGWELVLRPLADADIRGLRDGEDAASSEGWWTLSWIWATERTNGAELNEGMNEALRIEWCKMRAQAQCWQEECILLSEEMRRVIQFHCWQAKEWETRALATTMEGPHAYA
ncbi:hypothetical protein BDN71DRAFT_1482196 [Pleurotus eryngii]|uniref:CxC2-like cysteine cluster KDZ transposase-associated domain-containing protein n=1 Tax=Pleurotus eryngii TaxID=5323 RepID=A0A9P5ZY62_PLEER|nr:hypothetical protein BDN71DRAFT_1482196 [Pleurotus eryngii]